MPISTSPALAGAQHLSSATISLLSVKCQTFSTPRQCEHSQSAFITGRTFGLSQPNEIVEGSSLYSPPAPSWPCEPSSSEVSRHRCHHLKVMSHTPASKKMRITHCKYRTRTTRPGKRSPPLQVAGLRNCSPYRLHMKKPLPKPP